MLLTGWYTGMRLLANCNALKQQDGNCPQKNKNKKKPEIVRNEFKYFNIVRNFHRGGHSKTAYSNIFHLATKKSFRSSDKTMVKTRYHRDDQLA